MERYSVPKILFTTLGLVPFGILLKIIPAGIRIGINSVNPMPPPKKIESCWSPCGTDFPSRSLN